MEVALLSATCQLNPAWCKHHLDALWAVWFQSAHLIHISTLKRLYHTLSMLHIDQELYVAGKRKKGTLLTGSSVQTAVKNQGKAPPCYSDQTPDLLII
jgi:hypothetical protein